MTTAPRRRGPDPAKQQAVLDASLSVFSELGYAAASIELIAARADVSTRTIYNHFDGKAALLQATIADSAARVAAAQVEIIDRHLGQASEHRDDLTAALIAFATDWTRPLPDQAEHHALVEQMRAEIGRIPPNALDAWQEAGPLHVRRALARAFAALADRGSLRVEDPDLAALHFTRLVTITDPLRPGRRVTRKQAAAMITAGVEAFLHGYSRD
ncbi:TetR/AcrR family transcriptional regulator [Microlunatus soli]|uniref:DNA-binding transcriptional regulator, AcrR family n=1 Tax=Microlunatus soli TaxID=630515 RepID=A0A1H1Y8D7_9ACTN|nr:TetR/AcrR family transcriptional regulator [Microlunatus soli]SDT17697.1 DNA-binding transcriptional regulator, AcrR family [Microlunatus soli]